MKPFPVAPADPAPPPAPPASRPAAEDRGFAEELRAARDRDREAMREPRSDEAHDRRTRRSDRRTDRTGEADRQGAARDAHRPRRGYHTEHRQADRSEPAATPAETASPSAADMAAPADSPAAPALPVVVAPPPAAPETAISIGQSPADDGTAADPAAMVAVDPTAAIAAGDGIAASTPVIAGATEPSPAPQGAQEGQPVPPVPATPAVAAQPAAARNRHPQETEMAPADASASDDAPVGRAATPAVPARPAAPARPQQSPASRAAADAGVDDAAQIESADAEGGADGAETIGSADAENGEAAGADPSAADAAEGDGGETADPERKGSPNPAVVRTEPAREQAGRAADAPRAPTETVSVEPRGAAHHPAAANGAPSHGPSGFGAELRAQAQGQPFAQPAADAAPRMPAPPADQLAIEIGRAVREGRDGFTLELRPGDLGRISVDLRLDDDRRVTATIRVDRPETLHLLQRDSHALERALQDAGLRADPGSLTFDLRGEGGREHPFAGTGEQGRPIAVRIPAEAAEAASQLARPWRFGDTGVDISV